MLLGLEFNWLSETSHVVSQKVTERTIVLRLCLVLKRSHIPLPFANVVDQHWAAGVTHLSGRPGFLQHVALLECQRARPSLRRAHIIRKHELIS
jgi:hypothetical protein